MLKVNYIECCNDYKITVVLSNGLAGIFDVRPYLDKGIFTQLNNIDYFKQVKINFAGIYWPNGQDFSADTIEYFLQPVAHVKVS